MLPYEAVRAVDDPRHALLDFLAQRLRVAVTLGGWDARGTRVRTPPPPARG